MNAPKLTEADLDRILETGGAVNGAGGFLDSEDDIRYPTLRDLIRLARLGLKVGAAPVARIVLEPADSSVGLGEAAWLDYDCDLSSAAGKRVRLVVEESP